MSKLWIIDFLERRGWIFAGCIGRYYRFKKPGGHVLDCHFDGWYHLYLKAYTKEMIIKP